MMPHQRFSDKETLTTSHFRKQQQRRISQRRPIHRTDNPVGRLYPQPLAARHGRSTDDEAIFHHLNGRADGRLSCLIKRQVGGVLGEGDLQLSQCRRRISSRGLGDDKRQVSVCRIRAELSTTQGPARGCFGGHWICFRSFAGTGVYVYRGHDTELCCAMYTWETVIPLADACLLCT